MSGVLAGGLLPVQAPGWATATYWAAGILTSSLLFAGLLLHELAHCWVARHQGMVVQRITLFVFGGVSEIEGEPASPETALRIAVAGPLTSLALAALYAGAASLAGGIDVVASSATLLARLNVVLALFNLLPGHPLDGGRVLHAVVWLTTGDRGRATMVSARAGRWVSLGIVSVGVLLLVQGALVGLWLVIIGWFQHATAVATAEKALLHRALAGVTVAEVMSGGAVRVRPGVPLDRLVADQILGSGERCILVADDGRLRGLVTLRDLRAVPRDRWGAVGVEAVMRPAERLVTTTPEEPLLAAVRKMDDARVAQLPVLAGGRLVGLLTREEVLRRVRTRLELQG
jgi:Zn-dependent protease